MDSMRTRSLEDAPAREWGVGSSTARLRRVFVRSPTTEGDFVGAGWIDPDPQRLLAEHEEFVSLLNRLGCRVEMGAVQPGLVDAVYTHDPAIMTPRGAIVLNMHKPIRQPEPGQLSGDFARLGIPVIGRLDDHAFSDGGDKVWLDDKTLVLGRGYRTNDAAIAQITSLVEPQGVEVTAVDLPHYHGGGEVLHLMSLVSPLSDDLAAVFAPFVPVRLMELLSQRGITALPIEPAEFDTQAGNILAIQPGVVMIARGNPRTVATLRRAGCEVHEFAGDEVAIKGTGGPTCLTQPLWRAP